MASDDRSVDRSVLFPQEYDRTALTRTVRTKISPCPEPDCECWLWTGSLDSSNYGKVKIRNRTIIIHRYVYEFFHGPIPDDLTVDHLCAGHRNCVNPAHMELVTLYENSIRANERRYKRPRSQFNTPIPPGIDTTPTQQPQPERPTESWKPPTKPMRRVKRSV